LLLGSIQPSLRRYLRDLVGAADAEDTLQEVLLLVYRKLSWLEKPELLRPWAFRIASRSAFRHLKNARRRLEDPADEALLATMPAPNFAPPAEGLPAMLEGSAISPASRAVLILHFQEGLTLPEVAAVLEIPLGTAKSRLAYGLTTLRKKLAKERS